MDTSLLLIVYVVVKRGERGPNGTCTSLSLGIATQWPVILSSLAQLTEAERRELAEAVAKLTPEDRKLAEAQMFCAINHDSPLGSQGPIRKVMCNNKLVFVCCKGCADDAHHYPDDALAVLEKLQAKLKVKK